MQHHVPGSLSHETHSHDDFDSVLQFFLTPAGQAALARPGSSNVIDIDILLDHFNSLSLCDDTSQHSIQEHAPVFATTPPMFQNIFDLSQSLFSQDSPALPTFHSTLSSSVLYPQFATRNGLRSTIDPILFSVMAADIPTNVRDNSTFVVKEQATTIIEEEQAQMLETSQQQAKTDTNPLKNFHTAAVLLNRSVEDVAESVRRLDVGRDTQKRDDHTTLRDAQMVSSNCSKTLVSPIGPKWSHSTPSEDVSIHVSQAPSLPQPPTPIPTPMPTPMPTPIPTPLTPSLRIFPIQPLHYLPIQHVHTTNAHSSASHLCHPPYVHLEVACTENVTSSTASLYSPRAVSAIPALGLHLNDPNRYQILGNTLDDLPSSVSTSDPGRSSSTISAVTGQCGYSNEISGKLQDATVALGKRRAKTPITHPSSPSHFVTINCEDGGDDDDNGDDNGDDDDKNSGGDEVGDSGLHTDRLRPLDVGNDPRRYANDRSSLVTPSPLSPPWISSTPSLCAPSSSSSMVSSLAPSPTPEPVDGRKRRKIVKKDPTFFPIKCPLCPRQFKSVQQLHRHEKTHDQPVYQCLNCNHPLSRLDSIKRHMEARRHIACLQLGWYIERLSEDQARNLLCREDRRIDTFSGTDNVFNRESAGTVLTAEQPAIVDPTPALLQTNGVGEGAEVEQLRRLRVWADPGAPIKVDKNGSLWFLKGDERELIAKDGDYIVRRATDKWQTQEADGKKGRKNILF